MNKKRVLITGASGFIGGHLMRRLQSEGDVVLGTGRSKTPQENGLVCLDLLDSSAVNKLVEDFLPTHVVHLAAIASVVYSDTASIYAINVVGTQNLLEALRLYSDAGVKVILASTAGVYGNQDVGLLSEDLPFNASNHYSISKMSMEVLSRQYEQDYSINIIRPFNIIGVGQEANFLIPKLTKLFAQQAGEIDVGNISSVRDYVDVDFCVDAIIRLLTLDGSVGVTNICHGHGHSGEQILHYLTNITGHEPKINRAETLVRRSEVWRLVGCPEKMSSVLNLESINEGGIKNTLKKIVDSYLVS